MACLSVRRDRRLLSQINEEIRWNPLFMYTYTCLILATAEARNSTAKLSFQWNINLAINKWKNRKNRIKNQRKDTGYRVAYTIHRHSEKPSDSVCRPQRQWQRDLFVYLKLSVYTYKTIGGRYKHTRVTRQGRMALTGVDAQNNIKCWNN